MELCPVLPKTTNGVIHHALQHTITVCMFIYVVLRLKHKNFNFFNYLNFKIKEFTDTNFYVVIVNLGTLILTSILNIFIKGIPEGHEHRL